MAEIVKVVLSGQDQIDQLNADCARLRALLREAKEMLENAGDVAHVAFCDSLASDCNDLVSRIAAEVEDGK